MDKYKLQNYTLVGSIHTLQINSAGFVKPEPEVANCVESISQYKKDLTAKTKINPNKLTGDIFTYSEFKLALDTILAGSGVDQYELVRVDFRMDSYDQTHYQDFAKLNRYLISMLAVTYKVKNCYRTDDLFSQKQLTTAIKNKYFEAENYDKVAEQKNNGGQDVATSRLEFRSKSLESNDIKKEFLEHWFQRLDKAVNNIDMVHKRYNQELLKLYQEGKNATPRLFRTITDFIMQYQNCFFTRSQLIDFLAQTNDCKNPEEFAKAYKRKYDIEYFYKKDVKYALNEIKNALSNFFES